MNTHTRKACKVVALCISLAAAGCVAVVATATLRQGSTKPPKVVSKVRQLEVTSVTIENPGESPGEAVVIEIFNNSDRPVLALSIESGDDKDTSGIAASGFVEDPPLVVIQPYGRIIRRMPTQNLLPGKPLKVSAAIFADGGVEGEPHAKDALRKYKERDEKERDKKNEQKNDPPN
jgi:P pilus assembly chaperone PapD